MEARRLPVDAVAAAVFGGLLGALFVVLERPDMDAASGITTGSLVFGTLGLVRWMHRLGERG